MDTASVASGVEIVLVMHPERPYCGPLLLLLCVLLSAAIAQQPADFESLLASAQQAQAKRDFEAASGFYRQASAIHPESAELKANLGLMYYQINKDKQAVEAFQQAIRLNPGLFVPNLFLGLDYVKLKQFHQAVPYLKHAARSKPDDIHAQVALGQAYTGLGDTQLAIRSYLRATQIEPRDGDVWYRLGLGYLEQVEADARLLLTRYTVSAYLEALMAENFAERSAFNEASESYKKALALNGSLPDTHAGYAFVLLNQHDLPGAERELNSELATNPGSLFAKLGMARLETEKGSAQKTAEQIAQIWNADAGFLTSNVQQFKAGLAQVKSAELHHALEKLEASGELDERAASLFRPEASEASFPRGSLSDTAPSNSSRVTRGEAAGLYRKGAYRQCSDLLVSQLPTLPRMDLELLARCSFATGDYKRAFDAAGKLSSSAATGAEGLYWEIRSSQKLATEALAYASEIDSSSPKLHVLLGDTYRQQEHLEVAEQEYLKALALEPQDTGALFGLSLALLADGKTDQALHTAQTAIKLNLSDPELNAVLGEILCQRENYSDAERYLKESLSSKPKYASHVHALLGKVYANTNRPQEAIAELKLALPEDRDGHLHYQIGRLYLKIGDRDAAQRALLVSKRLGSEALNRTADLGQGQHDRDFR